MDLFTSSSAALFDAPSAGSTREDAVPERGLEVASDPTVYADEIVIYGDRPPVSLTAGMNFKLAEHYAQRYDWKAYELAEWMQAHRLDGVEPGTGGGSTPGGTGSTPGGLDPYGGGNGPYPRGPLGEMCETEHQAWCDTEGMQIAEAACEAKGLDLRSYWCPNPNCKAGHPTHWEVMYTCVGTRDISTFRQFLEPD